MLDLQNVTKTFGNVKALDDLTMTVPRGAVYGLVGPNGAGKSTAIRCLLGVYRPDCGTVTLDGAPVYENPVAKARIGSIPDDIFYFPSATLEDMRKYYKGMYPKFDDALFERLYEVFNLPKKGQIRRFSKGMQKQAAFHLASCCRPDVLILGDSPENLEVLHESASGRLQTIIVRGKAADVEAAVQAMNPTYYDILPLSLEEIFIYELGGVNYEVKNIIL